ncbi:MAG: hypothetical protein LBH40_00855 [Alphaproteobacteria bacterium]|jgi:hypothetical protein|nr:hypothetical protein [Alphaproteobacteria bacterium]
MLRFLILSLVLHVFLFAIVLGFSFYSPKPKTIQITLATLPKTNNVKKESALAVDEKKVAEKKTAEVQELLDSVLKEDIQEKVIEKAVEETPKPQPAPVAIKSQPKSQVVPKSNIPSDLQDIKPKEQQTQAVKPTPTITSKESVAPVLPVPQLAMPQPNPVDNTPNPYLNAVAPQEEPQPKEEEVSPSPYNNPVMPNVEQKSAELPTPKLPARKIIDVSSAKDDNLKDVVSSISDTATDIMSDENHSMSDSEKQALSNQIAQCVAPAIELRDDIKSISLIFSMGIDAKIKDIQIVRDNKIISHNNWSNLEKRVISLFNNPKCATLILPQGKFNYWQKFTMKINLRGFFE